MTEITEQPGHDRTEPVDIQVEMQRSYIDYAMSVIVGRALPDVRDGLKPVHTRILYAMYDGGFRPDRGYFKCSRVVGEVMGNYHPHGDSAIYDALVRMAQPWSMRMPLVDGQGNFGSPGNDPPAAMRYTECRLAPLAMEMLRDINEDTVDFRPNYDGRSAEPVVLPARFPNLLVNGSEGIAVGMATKIPPHNLREVAAGVQWYLENYERFEHSVHAEPSEDGRHPWDDLLDGLMERIPGPDLPTSGLIVGRRGIREAYRTGRGSITMRAVVDVEEDNRGRTCLVVKELPFQVNPENLAVKIAELVRDGRVSGIADIADESSQRTGQRLVLVLKRDAVAKVVLNNLYKHTQLQDTFGVIMLALVDGVPRTLRLDQMIRYWVAHQIEVIQRRTRFRLRKAQERLHIVAALLAAIDAIDEVIALIRGAESAEAARGGLMALLNIDEVQATAILDMQLRRLAALERQHLIDERDELETRIADLTDILESPGRQRRIIGTELGEIVDKYGDARRTEIIAFDGDVTDEDLIAESDIVVTITRGGYAKRTNTDQYRAQRRGGKGVRGAQLRSDDIVDHFFVTSTHQWILFFTNKGRVYRAKGYELPDTGRDARGQHVANLLAFQPDEHIAEVLTLPDYQVAPYLVLATKSGLVKKSRLGEFDSSRSGGLIAINLRADDEVISASLVSPDDDLLLVSKGAQALRFSADDDQLRPMGRATSGVIGMRFNDGDELLGMYVARDDEDVLVATENGYAKRTPGDQYPLRGRGGLGVITARIVEDRGRLVGALMVRPEDEVFAITSAGGVIRTRAGEVKQSGRQTMGVRLMNLASGDSVVALARNAESDESPEIAEIDAAGDLDAGSDADADAESAGLTAEPADSEEISADESNDLGENDV
ncbi:MAG TPA: DNA gyrase subunit A [Trebonia sp.]|nr:DNA gyrase subunit A [Trebonia sp.]